MLLSLGDASVLCCSNATMLLQDLQNLNEFFMNKEEDIVIRLQNLEDRSNSLSNPEEQQQIKSAFVKLHGGHLAHHLFVCLRLACLALR